MKPNEQRQSVRRLPNPGVRPTGERSLTLAEQRARSRWKPSVPAMIADVLASNRGLLERLKRGMYGPDMEHKEQYEVILNGLFATTRQQIEALEVFGQVDWE